MRKAKESKDRYTTYVLREARHSVKTAKCHIPNNFHIHPLMEKGNKGPGK